jgi:alpha-mannosidase
MVRKINIVSHTHWDREWYLPFQTYRTKLVKLIDSLLDYLEDTPEFTSFMLDGQMAVIDDYLQIRPENKSRLINLTKQGRIKVGPWYILMDEFLVSGETIVRNLQLGMSKAAEYGGHLKIGYLPDMFGHIAQMPQILKLANLNMGVVWRGVPSTIKFHRFKWEALDKTEITTEFLMSGYGNGANLPNSATALINRILSYEKTVEQFVGDDPLLLMNGSDHLFFQPFVPEVIKQANEIQNDLIFEITDLESSLSLTDSKFKHSGELRSSAYSNLLMGVTSNRIDVRQLARKVELAVENYLEPLYAIFSDSWPKTYLDLVWQTLIHNSAHDSICACSINEVVTVVKTRYLEALQICNALLNDLYAKLAKSLKQKLNYTLNPSSRPLSSVVEFDLDNHEDIEGTQVLFRSGSGMNNPLISLKSSEVAVILTQLNSNQIDDKNFVTGVDVNVQENDTNITINIDSFPNSNFSVDLTVEKVKNIIAEYPDNMVNVSLASKPKQRLLALCNSQPGYSLVPLSIKTDFIKSTAEDMGETTLLKNGFIEVVIDKNNGEFSINTIKGFNKIVDSGDQGDTYNYSPPDMDTLITEPINTGVEIVEKGPVRSIVKIQRTFKIPEYINDFTRKREGEVELKLDTFIELLADEKFLRVSHYFINTGKDHRIRTVFPIDNGTDYSTADTAFGFVKRGLTAEGGPSEKGLPTFPANSILKAGNLKLFFNCVSEYELTDIKDNKAHSVSVTMLRAVRYLSRITMTNRPLSAGPNLETSDAQLLGASEFSYAVSVEDNLDLLATRDQYLIPLITIKGQNESEKEDLSYPKLKISGCQVSSLIKNNDQIQIRIFNPTEDSKTASIENGSGLIVDLLDNPIEPFDGAVELRPFGIATIRLSGIGN